MTKPLAILPLSFAMALEQTGASLNPPHRSFSGDRLMNVGQGNLRELLKALRAMEKSLSHQIGNLERTLGLFHRKSHKQLAQEAEFSVDVETLNAGMYPESKTRLGDAYLDYGHSTFVRCGSCKHFAHKGEKVKCTILSKFDEDQAADYDSPCLVRQMPVRELAALSRQYLKRIQTLKDHRNIVRKQIWRTRALINDSVQLPILPDNPLGRRVKFKYGDRVRVYVFSPCCRKVDRNRWQPGTVLHERRDFVVCFDHPIMTGRAPRDERHVWRIVWPKHVWFSGDADLIVLHEWEYQKLREMFQADPKDPFLATWRSFFMKEYWPRDDLSGQSVKFSMQSIVDELFHGEEIEPLGLDRRLMSPQEAAVVLELEFDDDITPAEVVQAYRRLFYKPDRDQAQLGRAKDTLLLRNYGTNSSFD